MNEERHLYRAAREKRTKKFSGFVKICQKTDFCLENYELYGSIFKL
jgi:hypothetical protein